MISSASRLVVAVATLASVACIANAAERQAALPNDPLKENFLAQHEIGRRFQVTPADLPAPKTGPIVTNRSLTVPYQGQSLQVPAGFTATPWATGLTNPRRLLVLPNGDVIVAEQSAGYLTLLRDEGDGHAKWINRHVEDLNKPYGLAWRDGNILVTDQDGIWSVPHVLGALRAGRPEPTQTVDQVPPESRKPVPGAYGAQMITRKGVFGIVQGHQNRQLAIDPKSGDLFVGVGSSGNLGVEPEPKATIQRFDRNGGNQTTFASGTRNPTAFAFHPETGDLWAVVQERDGLGDRLVPDYLIRVQQGGFYGWPYSYIGKHPQPGFAGLAPDKVNAAITPDLLFEAHSSTLDIVFYTGDQFPPEYRGSAFVALKGSWNRSEPTGYKVVRVPFKSGRPEGSYENFATGFWASGERRAEVWGRPAALAVAKDGALLVADDTGGTIWRIAYTGAKDKAPAESKATPPQQH
ncbi:MAG: PQQ-dependent sugar dehydrogenase [Alphaproteobacteria bacterium]|nr:PQQ-dependent sugar dehydrogenase [Alphaproteobacteria bacterium]